jgi:hypothetical protein
MALILLSGKINISISAVFVKLISVSGQGYTGPNTVGYILLFYLMMEADLMTDTLYITYVPQTVDIIQQNIRIMRQSLAQTFRESGRNVSIIYVGQERTGER